MIAEVSRGERDARLSLWMLLGLPAALAFSIFWSVRVKTSPMVADDERIRGWETVLRELPATLLFVVVIATGLSFAVRAGRRGALPRAHRAIWLHGLGLFFFLLITVGGSVENIMTTRPSTVKWVLFPLEIGLTALVVFVARRAASRPRIGQ